MKIQSKDFCLEVTPEELIHNKKEILEILDRVLGTAADEFDITNDSDIALQRIATQIDKAKDIDCLSEPIPKYYGPRNLAALNNSINKNDKEISKQQIEQYKEEHDPLSNIKNLSEKIDDGRTKIELEEETLEASSLIKGAKCPNPECGQYSYFIVDNGEKSLVYKDYEADQLYFITLLPNDIREAIKKAKEYIKLPLKELSKKFVQDISYFILTPKKQFDIICPMCGKRQPAVNFVEEFIDYVAEVKEDINNLLCPRCGHALLGDEQTEICGSCLTKTDKEALSKSLIKIQEKDLISYSAYTKVCKELEKKGKEEKNE